MSNDTRKIAVITGDIVGSTALGPDKLERAMTALADCAEVQADWHGESLRFTRNRGDGWQVLLARPEMALRSALAFRAALRAEGAEFDSYFGIAEGRARTTLADDLNLQTGLVFEKSGIEMEHLKSLPALNLRMGHYRAGPLLAAIRLADHISRDWTPPQAAALLPLLDPNMDISQTDIAKSLGKSRQAVAKSLDSASYRPLYLAIRSIESERKEYD